MYFINNKYYLKQLLWLLNEEKKFYANYTNYTNYTNLLSINQDYINNVYNLIMLLEK
jgi:hypothetical protein